MNKVNLKTGKKLDERKGTAVERTRQMNDEIAKKQGWQSDCPPCVNINPKRNRN
ncbi:relaxase/mobilization nuclease domain-containing protein [Levilactobacillus brevis]